MPPESTVRLWALDDRDGFAARYARAREIGYLAMADDLIDIADDTEGDVQIRDGQEVVNYEHIQRSKLRIDTRKWTLSKVLPKIYGDKVAVDNTSSDGTMTPKEQASPEEVARRVAFLLTNGAKEMKK